MTDNISEAMTGDAFLEFYSPECSYCRAAEHIVNKLSDELCEVEFYKVNTKSNENLTHSFNIRSLPTFIMLSNGKEIGRAIGAKSEKDLKALISLA